MLDKLPEDLLLRIFLLLPATTLHSVVSRACKPWRALIRDPSFRRRHLLATTTTTTASPPGFLVHEADSSNPYRSFFNYVGTDGEHRRSASIFGRDLHVYHSHNGLLLTNKGNSPLCPCIRNPLLGESLDLPIAIGPNSAIHTMGLGFDPISHLYKVFLITSKNHSPHQAGLPLHCFVCSVDGRGNSWRPIGPLVYWVLWRSNAVVFDGGPHWMANHHLQWNPIVSFDVHEETLNLVPSPPTRFGPESRILVLEGKLCMYAIEPHSRTGKLWSMERYGEAGSWSVRYTLSHSVFSGIPVGVWKGTDVLFRVSSRGYRGGHVRYDSSSLRMVDIVEWPHIHGNELSKMVEYRPSLVSPVNWNETKAVRSCCLHFLLAILFSSLLCFVIVFLIISR